MATRDEIIAIPDRYIAAVSAGDVDTIMSLYNDNPRVEDPIGEPAHEGADAVRAFYTQLSQSGFKINLTASPPSVWPVMQADCVPLSTSTSVKPPFRWSPTTPWSSMRTDVSRRWWPMPTVRRLRSP